MFIKPINVQSLPPSSSSWTHHAGNTHFVLQSRKKETAMRSFFSGFSSGVTLGANGSNAAYIKSLLEYDFRILLRLGSKKSDYVVAVDSSFEKIHVDWNWVEKNLMLKLAEIDARNMTSKQPGTAEHTDNLLLRQFEEMTDEYGDPQGTATQSKLTEVTATVEALFPPSQDDLILNFYACTYWATETASARGQLCIGRNAMYFFGSRQPGGSDSEEVLPIHVAICITYKDVLALELVTAKRVLVPDSIQVGIKDKSYHFALYFARKEVFRILCMLCNAAMNRLIKGAENSLSASSEMFSKNNANMTGDLAVNVSNRGGGLLIGRSRDQYGIDAITMNDTSITVVEPIAEEFDVGTLAHQNVIAAASSPTLDIPTTSSSSEDVSNPSRKKSLFLGQSKAKETLYSASHTVVRYSHIKTATVKSLSDLDEQTRNLEFRNLFRLSYHETIVTEENPCYFYHKAAGSLVQGYLYLSQNFLAFTSLAPIPNSPATTVTQQLSTSILFESPGDSSMAFVIPYPHIVSIKKQPPTALPSAGKLSAFSLSGYLVISTKNKAECWLSFSNTKARDRVSDAVLSQIKTVDWQFDDDVVIGSRVAFQKARRQHHSNVNANEKDGTIGGTENEIGDVVPISPALADLTLGIDVEEDKTHSHRVPSEPQTAEILTVGLQILIDSPTLVRDASPTRQKSEGVATAMSLIKWSEYFDSNGRDVCLVKDMKELRELIVKTRGVPDEFRGDFWMLVSGAWYSKPEKGYYSKLLSDNAKKANPFALEIEKDVHRSLPEHPAYQDKRGIDALRRILTAFSWRNPAIGYAQALNIISAVLLLHIGEEDAFWILCVIVERMLPDHYTKTLVGSVVDQSVFTQLVQLHLPNLAAHLNKLYMDLSTFSVPWFLCLYLNSVSLPVAIRFLDSFFLDGPKFLFWTAVGILKVNESKLISKGKDDDIFVAILKDFFTRLGLPDSSPDSINPAAVTADPSILDTMTGKPLYDILMHTVYNTLAPVITTETIESLRMRYRLKVVHQMEETNRKSQIRTLCEQVSLSFDEVAFVYDEVRRLEFNHGDEEEDPNGVAARVANRGREMEEQTRYIIALLGGWGLVSKHDVKLNQRSESTGINVHEKTISLMDVRRVFSVVGPWSKTSILSPSELSPISTRPVRADQEVVGPSGLNGSTSVSSGLSKRAMDRSTSQTAFPSLLSAEDLELSLVDRIYHYCSFQYNFVHRQKRVAEESGQMSQFGAFMYSQIQQQQQSKDGVRPPGGEIEDAQKLEQSDIGFNVDLAAIVHVLDAFMKQPLPSRLRFMFDLHDIDGDGYLSKIELKAVMDSFLQLFEKDKSGNEQKQKFVTSEGIKSPQHVSPGPKDKEDEDEETYLRAVSSFLNAALKMGQQRSNGAQDEGKRMARAFGGSSTSDIGADVGDRENNKAGQDIAAIQQNANVFKLSFNDFLLAVLSQNVFVQYFERSWRIVKDTRTGKVKTAWETKGMSNSAI